MTNQELRQVANKVIKILDAYQPDTNSFWEEFKQGVHLSVGAYSEEDELYALNLLYESLSEYLNKQKVGI